jgi:alcohol dehydrogenase
MDLEIAASLGCRFATAYRAVDYHARVRAGDWVAIHGCGGVGLSAVMIAAARGARVIAVDISPAALQLAQTAGAVAVVDATRTDPVTVIRELTGGGAQVSIDALGSVATCQNSLRCLRKRGRHIQIGLMVGDDDMPRLPMADVIAGELELIGSHGMPSHGYAPMLRELTDGTLRPER